MGRHARDTRLSRGALRAVSAALALVIAALGILPASAFWSAATTASSSGAAQIATVAQGATPSASVASTSNVTVSWAATTLSSGRAVSGYTITRYNQAGVAQAITAGCSGVVTARTCTETGLPDGLWTFTVTPRFASNWVGAASARSTAVRTDATAPVNSISRAAVSGGSFLSGTTLYYRGAVAGSLTLTNTLTDTGSGPASSTTGGFTGTSTGFSHTPSLVSTPAGGPFVSAPFTWGANTDTQPSIGIAGADAYGNVAGSTIAFSPDNTPPSGGAITYTNGYSTAPTTVVTLAAVADAASGPAGTGLLQRASTVLTGGTCGTTYSAYTTVLTAVPSSGTTTTAATPSGSCYRFQYVFADNVGNTTTTTTSSIVKARNYALIVSADSPANYFRLDDASTSTVIDDYTAASNNGTWFGGSTRGAAGAIVGDSNTAVAFDGIDDYGSVVRQISGDFSIELWMKTTQNAGTGTNWYNGAGLVDAEVSGVANDFGLALLSGGRLAAGTGNPDTTALSTAGYNDNLWHHVVMTRTQSTGVIRLYVDGALSSSATSSNLGPLTGSANLAIGRLQTGIQYFAGSLDEIALYPTVLTPAQISKHNLSGRN